MKKISINWISEEITILKITTRRRRSDRTTEMQSIYFKESQVDRELIWIIREGHFWWIWWYFWWNIISFWQILIIKLSDDLFTRISDEVVYQKFRWIPHLSKTKLYPATNDRSNWHYWISWLQRQLERWIQWICQIATFCRTYCMNKLLFIHVPSLL